MIAKWHVYVPDDNGSEHDYAHVNSATLYPGGVIFTPFPIKDGIIDRHRELIFRKERIELEGSDGDGFPARFFPTYEQSFNKQKVKDSHPFLYRSNVGKIVVEVPGTFPIDQLHTLLANEGVLMAQGVRGSRYIGILKMDDRTLLFTNWKYHMDESRQELPGFIKSLIDEKTG